MKDPASLPSASRHLNRFVLTFGPSADSIINLLKLRPSASKAFSSTVSAFHISWSKCCLCVCVDVNQGGTNRNHCTETCNLACTDLVMNPDCTPKTRSVGPTLLVKIARWEKWAWIGIFKQAEPHSPWCLLISSDIFTASAWPINADVR